MLSGFPSPALSITLFESGSEFHRRRIVAPLGFTSVNVFLGPPEPSQRQHKRNTTPKSHDQKPWPLMN
jgi:hypothetical protein